MSRNKNKIKINHKEENWNYWFAGLVDGDGYFYINKKKEIRFELTTHSIDSAIIYHLKTKLKGGSARLRSGSNSIRYRVKKREIICNIIYRLNGKLYNPTRLKQFYKVCLILNISFIKLNKKLSSTCAYLAGLIDSDGTISIQVSKSTSQDSQQQGVEGKINRLCYSRGYNQLTLKITSSHKAYLFFIQRCYFLGKIYHEKPNKTNKSPNSKYHWIMISYADLVLISNYIKTNPLKSVKMHRIRLCLKYFYYKKLKYHLKDQSTFEFKKWLIFCKLWFKYSF
jgi:ubiquinol-cytochrome c reductase cytochrome b subunit